MFEIAINQDKTHMYSELAVEMA